ncbi:hypothetical protein EVAR_30804_1 [Eumeta japonica]|uniref:Uncharacterized protein n=1 Tax=Eumeta variegata TaxID=151549 RepID=A0A4C1V6V3_EUMVA|nr:hypothetical protein EVAR_30804_1 [Eumeta japonica]
MSVLIRGRVKYDKSVPKTVTPAESDHISRGDLGYRSAAPGQTRRPPVRRHAPAPPSGSTMRFLFDIRVTIFFLGYIHTHAKEKANAHGDRGNGAKFIHEMWPPFTNMAAPQRKKYENGMLISELFGQQTDDGGRSKILIFLLTIVIGNDVPNSITLKRKMSN